MTQELFESKVLNDFIPVIKNMGVGKTLADKIRISLAIGLFVERSVSLERAAELAGQPLGHFIDILRSKGISWAEYTEEMMGQDEFAVKKFLEETGSRHE